MAKENQLGRNIRSLREMCGDTLGDLANALHISEGGICNYERGYRRPDIETLQKIATRYQVTVDELLSSDLTATYKIDFLTDSISKTTKYMLEILPLIEHYEGDSDDKDFTNGVRYCKQLKKAISCQEPIRPSIGTDIEKAFLESWERKAALEAFANILWFMFLRWEAVRVDKSEVLKLRNKMVLNKLKVQDVLDAQLSESEGAKQRKKEYIADHSDTIMKILLLLKEEPKMSELADYYLALKYMLNMVDNDLPDNMNKTVGEQMMYSYAKLGNKYAVKLMNDFKSIFDNQTLEE